MLQPKQPVDYTSNVYNALKQKVEGFDKTEEQFKAELSNPEYSSKVYNALKLKVDGFDKSYNEFSSLLKKKEPSQQSSQPISPEKVWGSKSQPKSVYDTLVTDQPKPAVASAISAGKPKIVSYDQYRVDKVKNDLSAIRQKTEQDKIDAREEVKSDFGDYGFLNAWATRGKKVWNAIVDVNAQGISAVIPGIEQVEQAPEAFRFDIDRSKKFVDKAKREHQDLVKEAIKQKTVNKNIQIPSYDPAKIKERALELAVEEKVGDKVQARVNDYMENLPDRYGNDLKQLVADKYGSEYKQSTKEAKNALDISVMSQKEADDSQLKVNNYANIFAQYKAKGQPVPKEIQARFFIDSKYNEDVHKQAIKDKDNHSNIVAKNNNLAENIDTFNRDYGFLSNTLKNLTSASLHIGSGILGGADYFASLEKNIANRIGIHKFDFAFDTASKIAKYSSEKLKKGAEYIESVSEKSAGVEDVNSIGGFGRFAINEVIAKNAPMLGLIAVGPVGVGAVVQSSIGETFEGMKEQQEMGEKQYSDLQLYGIPAAKGAVDLALFTFDGQMLKNFQRVIKDVTASQKEIMAKAALEQLLKKPATYKEVGKQILGKQMHGLAVMNGVTISKNIIDIVGGVDPDRSITEGTFDASAASLILVGAMHSVPTISAKIGYEITSDTKGMKLSSQILSLEKLMDNETLSQSTRDALKDQHKKATDKLGVVLKKQVRDIQSLSNDQYKEIVGINKKIVELKNKAQDVKIDEKLSDDMKTQILDGYAEDFIAANKRKGELVSNGAKAQFERLSTEEQDKYYKAAEDKLNKELNPDGTTNEKASVYDIVKEAIATKNLEDFEKSKDPLETVDSEPTPTQLTVNEKELEVKRLREKERLEKEKVDPNDKEKLDEIYNRYDKLISPLLRDIEGAKPSVLLNESIDIEDGKNRKGIASIYELEDFIGEDRLGEAEMKTSRETIDELKEDISKNGFKEPIVIIYDKFSGNGEASIVEGNHRIIAAKELGFKEIPVRIEKGNLRTNEQRASEGMFPLNRKEVGKINDTFGVKGSDLGITIREPNKKDYVNKATLKEETTPTEKTQGTPDVISEPIDLEVPKPKVEAPKEVETEVEGETLLEKSTKSVSSIKDGESFDLPDGSKIERTGGTFKWNRGEDGTREISREDAIRITNNKIAESKAGSNIEIRNYNTETVKGEELKVGDVYVRDVNGTRYVYRLLEKPTVRSGPGAFFGAKVEILSIGKQPIEILTPEPGNQIGKVFEGEQREGGTVTDYFKSPSKTQRSFGKVKKINNWEEVSKPTEKAKVTKVVEPKKVDTSKIDEEIDFYQEQVDYSNSKIYDIEDEIVNEKGNTKSGLIELREQVKKEIEEVKKDKSLSKDERLDKIEEIKYQIENFKEEQQDIIDSYKDDLQAEKADLKKNQKKLDKFNEQKKALLEQETAPVETKKEQLRKNVDDATKALQDAYNAFKTVGFALDPKQKAAQDLKNQAVLNKAIIDYGVAKFKEKAFTVKEFVQDLKNNGIDIADKIAKDLYKRIEKAHLAFANLEQGTNSEKVKEKAKGDIEKAYDLGFKEATAQAKDALSAQKEVLGIEKAEALSEQGKKFKEQKESIKQSIKDKIEKSKDAIKNINQIVAESLPLDKLSRVQVKSILNNAMKIFTYKDLNNGIENFVNHVDKVINDVEYQRQIQVKADLINEIKDSISPKSLLKKSEANVKKTKITLKAKESLKTFLDGYSNIDFENLDIPELETIKEQIGDIVKNGKTERQHIENQDRIVKDQIERQIPSFLSEKYENRVEGRFDLAEQLSKGNYMIVDGKIYKPSDLEFVQNNMPGKQTGELIEVPVNKAEANNDFIKKGGFLKNLREGKINKALFGGITGLIKRQNVGHSGIRATFQDLATDSKSMEFLNKHFVTPLELFKNKQIVTYREFTEPFETLLRKSFGKSEKLHTSLFNIWESELKKKGSTIINKKNEGTYEGKFLTQTDLKIELKREGKENYNIFENKSNSDVVQLYSELKDPMNVRKFLSDGHTIEDIKKIIDFVHSDPKLNDVANGNKSKGIQSLSDLYKNILPKVNETLDLNGHDTIGSKKYLSIEDHRLNEYNKARKAGNNKAEAEKIADEKTAVYAEVLKAFYGENVPEEVPYVPSAVEPTQEVDLDVLKQFEDFHNGNSTLLFGNLYGRKEGGSLVLRPFQDVFREYAQNSSRFIEGASSMKNVSNLFLGKANEKLLIKNLGSDWVNLAKNKSIGILTGKSEFDVMKKSDFGNKIGQWTTLKTGLQLVLTPVTMIGQVLGTPNFYMSLENLADRQRYRKIYTDSNLRGKYYKAILNSSLMDERINKSGHDVDSDMLRKMSNGKSAGVRELSSSLVSDGLILTAISDAAAILYGGIGLYGVEYERNFSEYKKTMSPKDADLKAERDAMIKLFAVAEKTQASSQEAFTGRYLKDPLAKALGLYSFQGPSIQMGSLAMEAYRDVKAGRVDKIDGLKKIAYFGMVGAIMFNAAKKLLPKDDDKVDATGGEFELANETFSDILNQFGILGKQVAILKDEILKSSFPKALGVPYDNSKEKVTDKILRILGQESPAFGATVRTAKKILDSDEQYSLYRRASAAIETVGLFPADKVNNIATRVTELFDTDFKWGDRVKILTGLMNETSMLKYKDKVEDIQKMSATPEIKGMNYKERIAYSKLKGQEAIDFKNSIEQENQLNFIERQMGILKENGIGYESEISRIKAEISRTKNSIVEDYIKPALELNESGDIEKAKKINEKFINMMIDMEKNNPEMYANIENNIQTMIDSEANKKSSFVNDIKKAPIGRARAMAIYSRFGDLLDPKDDMLVSINVLANAKLLDDVTVSAYKKLVSEQKLKERNK